MAVGSIHTLSRDTTGVITAYEKEEMKFMCLFKTGHVQSQHASDECV